MKRVQPHLFPDTGLCRSMVAESDGIGLLRPIIPVLWDAMDSSFRSARLAVAKSAELRRLDPHQDFGKLCSLFVKSNIVKNCSEFSHLGLSCGFTSRQQFHINFRDRAIIVPKKLRQRFHHGMNHYGWSNYPTNHNREFWDQVPEVGLPDVPRFIVGYEAIREYSEAQILIGYPVHGYFSWVTIIDSQEDALNEMRSDRLKIVTEGMDDPRRKGFAVKRRRKAKERADGPTTRQASGGSS